MIDAKNYQAVEVASALIVDRDGIVGRAAGPWSSGSVSCGYRLRIFSPFQAGKPIRAPLDCVKQGMYVFSSRDMDVDDTHRPSLPWWWCCCLRFSVRYFTRDGVNRLKKQSVWSHRINVVTTFGFSMKIVLKLALHLKVQSRDLLCSHSLNAVLIGIRASHVKGWNRTDYPCGALRVVARLHSR